MYHLSLHKHMHEGILYGFMCSYYLRYEIRKAILLDKFCFVVDINTISYISKFFSNLLPFSPLLYIQVSLHGSSSRVTSYALKF